MDHSNAERGAAADHAAPALWRLPVVVWTATRDSLRRLRQWNRRGGAGGSGLAALIETHALQSAGDATIAVALAGSLFFSVPTHEARSRVALYLLITMLPFAVVAPVLGPALDRFRHGRRLALAATMIIRALLALVIGRSLSGHAPSVEQALTLYPAALGVLVASKAYGIARSATVPRLVPEGMTLVQANSRLTLAGVIAPAVAGTFAVAVATTLGHRTELFLGAVVYVIAALTTARLPGEVDSDPETTAEPLSTGGLVRLSTGSVGRLGKVGGEVRQALRSAAALRWLSGFMLFFGAFLVRVHPFGGLSPNVCLAAIAVGIGAGNVLGTTLGPRTATMPGERLSVVLLGASTAACVVTVFSFGLVTVFALVLIAATTAAVSKLALDAAIQRQVDHEVRTSIFARSETTLQLSWVAGGVVGILLPTTASLGFAVASVVLGTALVVALRTRPTPAAPA
jgi:MFS family permease